MLGLADPVRAVDGLGLDGGVPPRVEQVDVFGGRQVQAEAAGLEADQEDRAFRGRSGTARPARRGCGCGRRGTRSGGLSWSSRSRTSARKLVNCEKTRTLCPSSTTSLIWGRSMSSLALGSAARVGSIRPGWQAAWRSRSKRFEDLDLRPVQLGGVLAEQAPCGSAPAAPRRAGAAPAPCRSAGSAPTSREGP